MWILGENGRWPYLKRTDVGDPGTSETRKHFFSTHHASNEKNCCERDAGDFLRRISRKRFVGVVKNVHPRRMRRLRKKAGCRCWLISTMQEMKDTRRALVRIGYDGRVHKTFRGHQAKERFQNEVRVLKYLESKGCQSVPRVLETHEEELRLVTTSCGQRVERIAEERVRELFRDLEKEYRVRHDDAYARNVTYSPQAGSFCLIDFEFATILDPAAPPGPALDMPLPDGPRGD